MTREELVAILDDAANFLGKKQYTIGELADRILAALEKEREGEMLAEGEFEWSEGCSPDTDALFIKNEKGESIMVCFDTIHGKRGQLIFREDKGETK